MSENQKKSVAIAGDVIGIDFSKRAEKNDPQVMIDLYTGDDEMWFKAIRLDAAWIDDFISVLNRTKDYMDENFNKLEDNDGYTFKSTEKSAESASKHEPHAFIEHQLKGEIMKSMITKFEYMEISFKELKTENYQDIDTNKLNNLGKDGWELVSVGGQCLFKRQVIE